MSHAELYWVFLLVSCSGAMKGTVPTWAEIGGDQRRPGGVRRPARVHLLRHLLLALVHDGREAEVDQLQLRLVAQRLEGEVLELNVAVAHLSRARSRAAAVTAGGCWRAGAAAARTEWLWQ